MSDSVLGTHMLEAAARSHCVASAGTPKGPEDPYLTVRALRWLVAAGLGFSSVFSQQGMVSS